MKSPRGWSGLPEAQSLVLVGGAGAQAVAQHPLHRPRQRQALEVQAAGEARPLPRGPHDGARHLQRTLLSLSANSYPDAMNDAGSSPSTCHVSMCRI